MNKEQQELLDDAYENYWNSHPDADKIFQYEGSSIVTRRMTEDEFVDMVKTDIEFSEKWGLKIDERELSLEERKEIMVKNKLDEVTINMFFNKTLDKPKQDMYENSIPTKLITVTYNNKTIESYE